VTAFLVVLAALMLGSIWLSIHRRPDPPGS
jgi:hypothetical protein